MKGAGAVAGGADQEAKSRKSRAGFPGSIVKRNSSLIHAVYITEGGTTMSPVCLMTI